jgi:hypothetical protein
MDADVKVGLNTNQLVIIIEETDQEIIIFKL